MEHEGRLPVERGAGRPAAEPPKPDVAVTDRFLALQRAAGNAAVSAMMRQVLRAPARGAGAKAPSGPAGKDDQEESWANPPKRPTSEPVLAGTIYFKTRDSNTDADDEAVLHQLAEAYAPWAARNVGKKGGERGLRGRIVGYADPRPSVEPNNVRLSAARAEIVERRLTRFVIQETTGLIEGDFDFRKEAGGVAPAQPGAELGAEEVSLGWQRRAEIYIVGEATEPASPSADVAPPPAPPPAVKPPVDGWERWVPHIQNCDARITQGVAAQVLAYLWGWGRLTRQVFDYTGRLPITLPVPGLPAGPRASGGTVTYVKHGGVLPFTAKRPPWWDARTSGYPSQYLGRRALDRKAVNCRDLADKALMMIRDMREVNTYIDLTVSHSNSAHVLFMAELRKDNPDVAKLREYAVPIEYLMFIWDATRDLSIEVSRLADKISSRP